MGSETLIVFASRTLEHAERNYTQLDRKGLAVAFATQHFHKYIQGRQGTFCTHHQRLLRVLGSTKPAAG